MLAVVGQLISQTRTLPSNPSSISALTAAWRGVVELNWAACLRSLSMGGHDRIVGHSAVTNRAVAEP